MIVTSWTVRLAVTMATSVILVGLLAAHSSAAPFHSIAAAPPIQSRATTTSLLGWEPGVGESGWLQVQVRTGKRFIRRTVKVEVQDDDGSWLGLTTVRTNRAGRMSVLLSPPDDGLPPSTYRLVVLRQGKARRLVSTALTINVSHAGLIGHVVASVNAMRVSAGLPPVVHNPALSESCQSHIRYLTHQVNAWFGDAHREDPNSPWYTEEGAAAGRGSILAFGTGQGTRWLAKGPLWNPFVSAPYHLARLLDPKLRSIGYGSSRSFECVRVDDTLDGAVPPGIYAFPGNGATNVPYKEAARERPDVPGAKVGIPAGTMAGPYLILQSAGGGGEVGVSSATLSGPEGSVPIVWYNDADVTYLIPTQPLRKMTRYRLDVTTGPPWPALSLTFTTGKKIVCIDASNPLCQT